MRTLKELIPGQRGTKKLVEEYEDKLVCVRYRYDSQRGRKIKTAEILINEGPWEANSQRIPGNKLVQVQIDYDETYLRRVVKGTGGRWNREKRYWELPYREVIALGLRNRIVKA
ncbi:MAG: hypothetical protein KAT86_03440 [Candidatus Latescibacteria bacterium]|nr:hypothetical protein [Candidatus Latescibacterota bacterium]